MTKKLKLPLRISSSAYKYTLSKSVHDGMVDLTADDGTVYVQHVTETAALRYLDEGAWIVVAAIAARDGTELAKNRVADAKVTFDAAKVALAAAEAALEVATKPYLA